MSSRNVVVVTPGRFHSFSLAEQLQRTGRLEAIYTGYPRFKLKDSNVEPGRIRTFPWIQVPYMAALRAPWIPQAITGEMAWRANQALDVFAAQTLPECGLVSALSASGLKAGQEIKKRGGVYVCDRASTHIVWQNQTLKKEYEALGLAWRGVDARILEKEQLEYEMADVITLPSQFTVKSFLEMGVPAYKLRSVPYGVDLSAFARSEDRAPHFRIVFVGQLSVRKGLHYLLEAFTKAALPRAQLVLVGGATADTAELLKRYRSDRIVLTGHLSRAGVVRELSLASVMVLPSIEEGLAYVQAQALACGCPVIATPNTGSEDLFEDGVEGFIVTARDTEVLAERLIRLYANRQLLEEMSLSALARIKLMRGWDSYGEKIIAVFDEFLAKSPSRISDAAPIQSLSI